MIIENRGKGRLDRHDADHEVWMLVPTEIRANGRVTYSLFSPAN